MQRLRWTAARALSYAEKARLGVQSDWADKEVLALGGKPSPRSGIYIWDNIKLVAISGAEVLGRLALFHPAEQWVDQYAYKMPKQPIAVIRNTLGQEIRDGSKNQKNYIEQIRRLAGNVARRPHSQLVLIDEPLSRGLVESQSLETLQHALVADFKKPSASQSMEYWPIIANARLTQADFFDDLHVKRGSPQAKVQASFVAELAKWIGTSRAK